MKGYNILGKKISALNQKTLKAVNPTTLEDLEGDFHIANFEEADEAINKAVDVAQEYANCPASDKALFLRTIASNIENLGPALINRVMNESGLPEGRVTGELGRTCGQLRFFAAKIEEGSWVNAIIDEGNIRQCANAIGPVVVFTASNFPLAFSTAGGDTASALAAGCPVIVKAHESHLGTNNLVAQAIQAAAIEIGIPDGVFSSLNGQGYELGAYLVKHDDVKAVAFTGSYGGGKALYDLAQTRKVPIPVFSEMGSVNPVFVLSDTMKKQTEQWSESIANSINMGAGQFCTNPGLLVVQKNEYLLAFEDQLVDAFSNLNSATMLNRGIHNSYERNKHEKIKESGVKIQYVKVDDDEQSLLAHPCLLKVTASDFIENPKLAEEVFGPFSIIVICDDATEMKKVVKSLEGQLTASFLGEEEELLAHSELINLMKEKVGRIIINALPTGVAVNNAMNHGGPFPATTDSRFTSVGGNAIYRFVRTVCYQGFPDALLPDALKDGNPLGIWRTVNGELGKN